MAEDPATLVVGPSWIGDMIMAQCLFKALRRQDPGRPLDVAAPAWAAPLLARMPEVRAAIELPFRHGRLDLARRLALGRSLRGRYDRAYVLPGSFKSALLPYAAGIARRTGYRGEFRYGLLNDIRPVPAGMRRRTAFLYQALAGGGAPETPSLAVDAANQAALCRRFGLVPGGFVALMPGAEYGETKRWPAEKYAGFAAQVASRGLAVAVLGSASDQPVGERLVRSMPAALNLCGQTRLEDAVDLLAAARLAVSNDSGLMHVAAAVGTPLVAIYGSTSPDNTPPLTARAEIVSLRLACSPCHQKVCPLGHLDCLNKLDISLVGEAARRLGVT